MRVGEDCFQHTEMVVINELPVLERVEFGSYSFNSRSELYISVLRYNTSLIITNCLILNDIDFGNFAFGDFDQFYIEGSILVY